MLTKLLSENRDIICFNEVFQYKRDVSLLPTEFYKFRKNLINHRPVLNKFSIDNKLTDDIQRKKIIKQRRVIPINSRENLFIGSKRTNPYIEQLENIINLGYKVIAMIRNPYYTIQSWNSEKVNQIPTARITKDNLHPRWNKLKTNFPSEEKYDRQAFI